MRALIEIEERYDENVENFINKFNNKRQNKLDLSGWFGSKTMISD